MVEFFFTHLSQTNLASTVSLHLLLNCLPSLVDLKNLISKVQTKRVGEYMQIICLQDIQKKYTMKEALVIKVVLEMYESYYKTFGAPNFKVSYISLPLPPTYLYIIGLPHGSDYVVA
jgi:hypothetical protein